MSTTSTRPSTIARAAVTIAVGCALLLGLTAGAAAAALPPIKHVFVVIEENESEATSFGPNSPAPYLSKTLVSAGAFVPNYYGIGHSSLDNYIAMVSGQAPNPSTSADCGTFADFTSPASMNSAGQENGQGCVYPGGVPTLMGQLQSKGLSWRAYEDGMGADPVRDNTLTHPMTCGHPVVGSPDPTEAATPTDQYATRHDPFVYFHSVIDNPSSCNANVVNASRLATDLKSVVTTPNYVFITPSLCNDGHDASCANGGPGGLAQADAYLKATVPTILKSPAFQQDGLLIVAFDESVGDAAACCGEQPGPYDAANHIQPGGSGPGGGLVGAVLLSKYIAPGTKSSLSYNHYSMLGSVEDIFGLGRLAAATGTRAFGADIFTRPPVAPQDSGLRLSPSKFTPLSHRKGGTTISYSDTEAGVTKLTVRRLLAGYHLSHQACRVLAIGHKRPRHASGCIVTRTVGGFTHADSVGVNRVAFSGRLGGRALHPGSYTITVVPTYASLTGAAHSVAFRVR